MDRVDMEWYSEVGKSWRVSISFVRVSGHKWAHEQWLISLHDVLLSRMEKKVSFNRSLFQTMIKMLHISPIPELKIWIQSLLYLCRMSLSDNRSRLYSIDRERGRELTDISWNSMYRIEHMIETLKGRYSLEHSYQIFSSNRVRVEHRSGRSHENSSESWVRSIGGGSGAI